MISKMQKTKEMNYWIIGMNHIILNLVVLSLFKKKNKSLREIAGNYFLFLQHQCKVLHILVDTGNAIFKVINGMVTDSPDAACDNLAA